MIPQFFLFSPVISDLADFTARLEPVIGTGALSVVLLRLATPDLALAPEFAALRGRIQTAGIACLMDLPAEPRRAATLELDGAHVSGLSRLTEAIGALKPARIVGAGGLKSRHEAMEAGEKDVDYVMFGEPRADASLPPLAMTIERAQWWSEIFTLPCIAYAPALDDVAALAATGADFVALGSWLFEAEDPALLAAQARRLAKTHAPAGLMA